MGNKETLRIQTRSGNTVEVTPDHRMGVVDGDGGSWREAQDCSVGDMLLIPRHRMLRQTVLSLSLSEPLATNQNRKTSGTHNVYSSGRNTWRIKIKHGEGYYTKSGFKSEQDAISARDTYCIENGISTENRSFARISKPNTMTPDLAYFIGAVLADGFYEAHSKNNSVRISCQNMEHLNRVARAVQKVFNLTPKVTTRHTKGDVHTINGVETVCNADMHSVRIRNNTLCSWLSELGVYTQHKLVEGKTRSRYLSVPWSILQADEKSQLAFLSAFIEGDGHTNEGKNFGISSSSEVLIRELVVLLQSHGYNTHFSERFKNHYTTTGQQVVTYSVRLPKGDSVDLEQRMDSCGYPCFKRITNPGQNSTKYTLGSFYTSEIVSIDSAGIQPVYDLTMQDQTMPAFVANGLMVHNCAHEVRGWSIISGDVGVADVFEQGAKLRRRFRLVPDKWIHHLIDVEGDVHKINASYFFGLPISEITKDIRNAVKTVIFGLIYQQGDEGLAKSTKRKVEEIVKIKKQFLDRFPVGYKWFDKIKKFAKKNFFVESPVGRRRNLWGYLIPRSFPGVFSVHSACDRRAVNSPVQGFGSDLMMSAIRQFDLMKYEYFKEHGVYPDIELSVSVHDSLTVSVAYEWFWLAVDFIERAMTSAVVARVQSRHKGFEFTSTPEIDMEIGATERDVISWDRSFEALKDILEKSLKTKRDELGDKIDIAAVKHQMLEGQYNIMPEWMKKQLWANDIKIETMDKINPMSDSEKRLAEKWRAELKPNLKKWLAHEKTKVVKDATSSKIRVPLARLKSLGIKKKKE